MKCNLYAAALIILVGVFISCKKGDDGLTGPQGQPGTANVKYSEWFVASPWKKDTVFSVWGFNYIKTAPAITQQILDSGAVLTFARLRGYNPLVWPATQVGQLPIDLTYQQGSVTTDNWSASATAGNLKIRFVNDKNYYTSIAATHEFRYIIIPGGLPTGRGVTFTYEDICKLYNIGE